MLLYIYSNATRKYMFSTEGFIFVLCTACGCLPELGCICLYDVRMSVYVVKSMNTTSTSGRLRLPWPTRHIHAPAE